MAKKRREPLTTRRMPSGAQQYVREGLNTIGDVRRDNRDADDVLLDALMDAFHDEIRLNRLGRQMEEQTRREDRTQRYAEGGKVRGCKDHQTSGRGHRGTF